jgi:penicillin-binding protein 1A
MYGETVSVERLPPHVWQAVVAIEDKRFFSHFGIDPRGLARAIWRNISSDGTIQGGSTITQQLAKNVFLSRRRSLARKIQEVMITAWLEGKFSKSQLLALYLNRVSLVGGKYGISTAAETLFGKPADKLDIPEAAIIAAMLKAPARYSPLSNPEASRARARIVLDQMLEQGFITKAQHAEALKYEYKRPRGGKSGSRYFIDYVMDELSSRTGELADDVTIHSTLDSRIQRTAENVASGYVDKEGGKYGFGEVAAVVIDTGGGIVAMVGGRDYQESQFNRAHQMRRQPGSLFKPFVYLAALGRGMRPTDVFDDRITEIAGWAPRNHDDRYVGKITMADALEKSVNTVPVQIAKRIGLRTIIDAAHRLGLVDKISSDYSIILGTSETTLLDLTAAYATFANGGVGVIPHSIARIEDSNGRTIYSRAGGGVGKIVAERDVADMNAMLRRVIEGGTGAAADIPGAFIRGKTGTSQNNRDAWFIGYGRKYAGGVWIGNDDNTPMSSKSYGGTIPARVFRAIMTYVLTQD